MQVATILLSLPGRNGAVTCLFPEHGESAQWLGSSVADLMRDLGVKCDGVSCPDRGRLIGPADMAFAGYDQPYFSGGVHVRVIGFPWSDHPPGYLERRGRIMRERQSAGFYRPALGEGIPVIEGQRPTRRSLGSFTAH